MCLLKLFISLSFVLILIDEVAGRYKCAAKGFLRLGNSCYLFSSEATTWQEAHFRCRDHDSQLAVLATQYEDNTVRNYLERPEFAQVGRWIGGMWVRDHWVWAAQGTEIESPTSFASDEVSNIEGDEEWNCLFMDPLNRFKWSNENCIRQLHYICEAPLTKSSDSSNNSSSDGDAATSSETLSTEPPPSSTPSPSEG